MKRRFFLSAVTLLAAAIFTSVRALLRPGMQSATAQSAKQERALENTLYLDLKDGRVTIKMRPDLAPNHVARIKELVREGFYDGIVFPSGHRWLHGADR